MIRWRADRRETWTPERRLKMRTLDITNGDVEKARNAWDSRQRELFVRWMVLTGKLNEGEQ